jgi:hypothetical protein
LDNFTENKNNEIEEAEEKLKQLRDVVAQSVMKQESLIVRLAELITKEKDAFFTYENNL